MIDEIIQGLHVAEISIQYKSKVKLKDRPRVRSLHEAYSIFRQSWDEGTIDLQEEFKVLFLNNAKRVLGLTTFSLGVSPLPPLTSGWSMELPLNSVPVVS
jgi:hypothetical protein